MTESQEKVWFFSPSIIKKNSSWNNPFTEHIGYSGGIGQGDLLIEELIHFFRPLNIIYIFFDEEDKENDEKDIYYLTVNEKNFYGEDGGMAC